MTQPDGSTLTLTLYGDENASWISTSDDILVVQQDNAYYLAQVDESGLLSASKVLAHEPVLRTAEERHFCQQQRQRHALFYAKNRELQKVGQRAQVTGTGYFPHQGNPKCLVILAQFSDIKFTSQDPNTQFEQYFNRDIPQNLGQNEDKNLCGVGRYFETSSGGKFRPQFDIVGPITLPESQEFYGKDNGSTIDVNFSQFCKDAITAVDGQVDFHDYDNDGDGKAELVCIIFAGYGQNVSGNPATSLWPKCGSQGISTADGVSVSYVNCSAELYRINENDPVAAKDINGLGVCVHEFSHGMGLPDLYATNTNAQTNNQTPEFWDLMDYGEHAGSGYTPMPYSAWEQEAMGWIEIEELTSSQHLEMTSLVKGGKAYKFGNGADPEEWMIIEYVEGPDRENRIPGYNSLADKVTHNHVEYSLAMHGLLVWHIAYANNTVNMFDYPNNTKDKPRVCIVPADGEVINGYLFGEGMKYSTLEYVLSLCGDAFPGTSSVSALSAGMNLPNYQFYNGETTPAFKLMNIQEDVTNSIVSFDFVVKSGVIMGDANGDGSVNEADITEIVNYILEKPSDNFVLEAADVNDDGQINVADIVTLVNMVLPADN